MDKMLIDETLSFTTCCTSFLSFIFCISCRNNGSLPSNAEIRDNVLTLKGPVTYDLQGTYVCDATNSIGTRSGSVEVSITGTFTWSLGTVPQSYCEQGMCLFSFLLMFVCFFCRKASTADSNGWCHQRSCLITGCWSAHGHYRHSPGAQNKK